MKVGIIGYGFVGKALANGFLDSVEIFKVDPKLGTSITELSEFNPNIIFICLPTPMSAEHNQNISIVKKAMTELQQLNLSALVVLKSTVLPDNLKDISSIYNNFIYNPEFLREKHAEDDFINSSLIIFGGDKSLCMKLDDFYSNHTKCKSKEYIHTDKVTASFVKYTINSFLATKVSFFNELNSLYKDSGSEEGWNKFIDIISNDKRIGDSHMQVPGHDGRYGFGGACLPKDSEAFFLFSEKKNIELRVLKTAITTNNKIRAKYNKNTKREEEQNINFGEED